MGRKGRDFEPGPSARGSEWWRQGFRFVLVGLINTGIGLAIIYAAMGLLGFDPLVANAAGYGVVFAVSVLLHRRFTFGSRRSLVEVFPRFGLVAAVSYLANAAVLEFTGKVFGLNPYVGQVLAVATYAVLMFLGSRFFVFANAA